MALWVALPANASDRSGLTQAEQLQVAQECSTLLDHAHARRAMPLVRAQLAAQGMELVLQACPYVRVGAGDMLQVLDVRVVVLNSDVAADFVRGPLADDEVVDMGDVQLVLPSLAQGFAPREDDELSPDVLFNRKWLSKLMQRWGLHAVPAHWWAFVPVPLQ